MTTTTTSATTTTGEETRTTSFRGEQIEYYPDSLKAVTNIVTNGFSLRSTITAEIDADIPRVDEHGDYADYGVIWFWSIEVDELGGRHLDYYEAIAKQLANLRINELQGE